MPEANLEFLLFYPRLRIAYNAIPKNACSTVKASLAYAEDGALFTDAPHELDDRYKLTPASLNGWTRLLVLRDPYDRLISAYLEKITRVDIPAGRRALVDEIHRELGRKDCGPDARPTFREFFNWVRRQSLHETDAHWRPQSALIGLEEFDIVLRMETLDQDWRAAGFETIAPLRHYLSHATSTYPSKIERSLVDVRGQHLHGFRRVTLHFPPHESFRDPEMEADARSYYAADYARIERLRPDAQGRHRL